MESYCFLERVVRSSQDKKAATRCGVRPAPPTPHCLSAAALRSCYCQPGIKHMHPHQPQPHQQPLTCVARPVLQPEKPSAATAAAAARHRVATTTTALRIMAASVGCVDVLLRRFGGVVSVQEAGAARRRVERHRCKKGGRWCGNWVYLPAEGRGDAETRQRSAGVARVLGAQAYSVWVKNLV